jgi:hypothetical protein
MKNILLVGFCLCVAGTCFAQRAHVIFAELAGNGGLGSINYDVRFSKKATGLGMRIGGIIINRSWIIPVHINYVGRDGLPFEVGIGVTNGIFRQKDNLLVWQQLLTCNLSYRRQFKNRLNFRAGWTPIFIRKKEGDFTNNAYKKVLFFWSGVSIGYRL